MADMDIPPPPDDEMPPPPADDIDADVPPPPDVDPPADAPPPPAEDDLPAPPPDESPDLPNPPPPEEPEDLPPPPGEELPPPPGDDDVPPPPVVDDEMPPPPADGDDLPPPPVDEGPAPSKPARKPGVTLTSIAIDPAAPVKPQRKGSVLVSDRSLPSKGGSLSTSSLPDAAGPSKPARKPMTPDGGSPRASVGLTLAEQGKRNSMIGLPGMPMPTPEMLSKPKSVAAAPKIDKEQIFNQPDSEDNILYHKPEPNQEYPDVRAGKLEKLVERLTFEKYPDPSYVQSFLLTYKSFTTPLTLMDLLSIRFKVNPPPQLQGAELKAWQNEKLVPIRLRVVNVLKTWLEKFAYDFEDKDLCDALLYFLDFDMEECGMEKAALQLKKLMAKKTNNRTLISAAEMGADDREAPPAITTVNRPEDTLAAGFDPSTAEPATVARHLAIIEHHLLRLIQAPECLNMAWMGKQKEALAPHILGMIRFFNDVSKWVQREVLAVEDVRARANTIKRFIDIAEQCRAVNNYNAIMEIISGLQSTPLHRLALTWEALPTKSANTYKELIDLMSRERNYRNLRQELSEVGSPCIPYLGVFLTDLTFIETGNPDDISSIITVLVFIEVTGETKQMQFDGRCLVGDMRSEIINLHVPPGTVEQWILNNHLMYLPGNPDNESVGKWMDVTQKLNSYDIKPGSQINLQHRRRKINVIMEDEQARTITVDTTLNVDAVILAIAQQSDIDMTGQEEFVLRKEEKGTEFLSPDKPLYVQGVDETATLYFRHKTAYGTRVDENISDRVLNLLYEDTMNAVVSGKMPVPKGDAVHMGALQWRAEFPGAEPDQDNLDPKKYLPAEHLQSSGVLSFGNSVVKELRTEIGNIGRLTPRGARLKYVQKASTQPTYGGTYFQCKEKNKKKKVTKRIVGVGSSKDQLLFLDAVTKQVTRTQGAQMLRDVTVDRTTNTATLVCVRDDDTVELEFNDVASTEAFMKIATDILAPIRAASAAAAPSTSTAAATTPVTLTASRPGQGSSAIPVDIDQAIILINFTKRKKVSEVIQRIQQYQSTPYSTVPVEPMMRLYQTRFGTASEDELMNLSLQREARARS